jgi:hypothetical protein
MSGAQVEHFLARLYTDEGLRERFLLEPEQVALAAGLGVEDAKGMGLIDKVGLQICQEAWGAGAVCGARMHYQSRTMVAVATGVLRALANQALILLARRASMGWVLEHFIQGGGLDYAIKPCFDLFLGGIFNPPRNIIR